MNENKIESIEEKLREIVFDDLDIEHNDSTRGTPHRIAKMWANELFANRNDKNIEDLDSQMTTFNNSGGQGELILCKDIKFSSTCEHHFLPFKGKMNIGYIADDKILGLSKIPRAVKFFSNKPQIQERLVREIGDYLADVVEPKALFVQAEATHDCIMCRGAESEGSTETFYSVNNTDIVEAEKFHTWRQLFLSRIN